MIETTDSPEAMEITNHSTLSGLGHVNLHLHLHLRSVCGWVDICESEAHKYHPSTKDQVPAK